MTKLIEEQTFGKAWVKLLRLLYNEGDEVSPRGLTTYEVINVSFVVHEGLGNILVNKTRDLNYRFMIAEWLWIMGGLNDVESLAKYNSIMRSFSDDGEILNGAYGPRLFPQWKYVAESLIQPWSRQAVASIWTTNPGPSKDVPCTLCLQWLLRDYRLHCIVTMRSSDAWLGLPYDFFTFSQLTNTLATMLNIEVGSITMNLASSHLYREHWNLAEHARKDVTLTLRSPKLPHNLTQEEARSLLDGSYSFHNDPYYSYQKALATNKADALEVLLELDSSQH